MTQWIRGQFINHFEKCVKPTLGCKKGVAFYSWQARDREAGQVFSTQHYDFGKHKENSWSVNNITKHKQSATYGQPKKKKKKRSTFAWTLSLKMNDSWVPLMNNTSLEWISLKQALPWHITKTSSVVWSPRCQRTPDYCSSFWAVFCISRRQ